MTEPFKPFRVIREHSTGMWCVLLEAPDDPDNFVVVHRSAAPRDCDALNDSLNDLVEKHVERLLSQFDG